MLEKGIEGAYSLNTKFSWKNGINTGIFNDDVREIKNFQKRKEISKIYRKLEKDKNVAKKNLFKKQTEMFLYCRV